jgi:hypothetical protein
MTLSETLETNSVASPNQVRSQKFTAWGLTWAMGGGHKNFRHPNSNNIELNSIIMKHIIQLASELATDSVNKTVLKILSICHESCIDQLKCRLSNKT